MLIDAIINDIIIKHYQAIKFIYQLNHTDDLARRIFYRHTKYSFMYKIWSNIYARIKPMIFVCIGNSNRLNKRLIKKREKWISE